MGSGILIPPPKNRPSLSAPAHSSLNNLAGLCFAQGDYARAEPLYKRSRAIREKVRGPTHLDVVLSLNNLAELYYAQDKYSRAEPFYRRSLVTTEKLLGPDHPDVANALENYANVLRKINRSTDAEKMEARARAIRARLVR